MTGWNEPSGPRPHGDDPYAAEPAAGQPWPAGDEPADALDPGGGPGGATRQFPAYPAAAQGSPEHYATPQAGTAWGSVDGPSVGAPGGGGAAGPSHRGAAWGSPGGPPGAAGAAGDQAGQPVSGEGYFQPHGVPRPSQGAHGPEAAAARSTIPGPRPVGQAAPPPPPAAPPPAPAQPPVPPPGPAQPPAGPPVPAPSATAPGRSGSPIIEPGLRPALITSGLCLLLALTAVLARPALAVAVVALQAVTAAGWFRLNGMWPARQGIALAFAAGVTTDIAMLAVPGENGPVTGLATLGVWCLLVLVQQLRHRGAADERLYGLTVTVSAAVVTVLGAGHLAAWSVGGPQAQGAGGGSAWSDGAPVVIGALAVAVAVLARALPLPAMASGAVALAAAAGTGAAAGGLTGVGAGGALLGLAAGGCALIGLRVASYDFPSRFVHFTAGVSLPLTAAAPAVYLIGRVLAG